MFMTFAWLWKKIIDHIKRGTLRNDNAMEECHSYFQTQTRKTEDGDDGFEDPDGGQKG